MGIKESQREGGLPEGRRAAVERNSGGRAGREAGKEAWIFSKIRLPSGPLRTWPALALSRPWAALALGLAPPHWPPLYPLGDALEERTGGCVDRTVSWSSPPPPTDWVRQAWGWGAVIPVLFQLGAEWSGGR